jgi:hypothetical protein
MQVLISVFAVLVKLQVEHFVRFAIAHQPPKGVGRRRGRAAFLFPVGLVVILAGPKSRPRVCGNAGIAGGAGPFSPVSLTESVPPDHADFVVGCCSVVVVG